MAVLELSRDSDYVNLDRSFWFSVETVLMRNLNSSRCDLFAVEPAVAQPVFQKFPGGGFMDAVDYISEAKRAVEKV